MSESFYEVVTSMREKDVPWDIIGTEFGKTAEAARSQYRRHKAKGGSDVALDYVVGDEEIEWGGEEAAEVFFPDKKHAEDINWRELLDLATKGQDINERMTDDQRIATIQIDTDKPIAITFSGDWHLGDGSTDHESWRRDILYFIETPNLYLIDMGDDIQNMRSFRTLSAVLGQVLSPVQQAQLLKSIIDELTQKNKLLAKVRGNHDVEFDERIFGQAIQKYLVETANAPMFNNRGLIKLIVGDTAYTILLFHKSRFRSFMRSTHGNYREYQLSFPADLVVGAHDHVPAFETMWHYTLAREAGMNFGGEAYLIKVGTYQDGDYGWKYFHNGGQLNPTVVLYPDRHKKVAFMDPHDAVQFMSTYKPNKGD